MPETEEHEIGLMAEFSSPEQAAAAALRLRAHGFANLEAYGPFPSEELSDAIGFHEHRMAPCVLGGGIVGGVSGFSLQYYTTVIAYPHNIGGRPHFSWPSYIPITFECVVLFACLTGIVSFLFLNRLPRLAHPVFSIANFERASTDRFFVAVHAGAAEFSYGKAREVLTMIDPPLAISVLKEAKS